MSLVEALALGLLIGLSLGALGGGGSILTVPALVYVLHEHAQAATTGSLVIVGITAFVGSVGHARSGNVRWRAGTVFGVIGIAASYGGTALNRSVNQNALLLAFGALMLVAAVAMVRRTPSIAPSLADESTLAMAGAPAAPRPATGPVDASGSDTRQPRSDPATVLRLVLAALVVGFLTGFLGVGGGFVIVPALVMVLDFPMAIAVGTSLLIIAINSAAALAARAGTGAFHWAIIIPFTIAAIAGSLAGTRVADKASGPSLTRAFAALLVAVASYVIIRSAVSLS